MRRVSLALFDLLLVAVIAITLFRLGSAEAAAHAQAAPSEADTMGIWRAYQGHAWWTLSALGIGLVVRALKDDKFILPARFKIAAPYRPAMALALGLVAGVLEKVGTGQGWQPSLLWGLSAGATAIFSHTLIVEAARGGQDIGAPPGSSSSIDLAGGRVVTVPDWPERPRGSGLTEADKLPTAPGAGS